MLKHWIKQMKKMSQLHKAFAALQLYLTHLNDWMHLYYYYLLIVIFNKYFSHVLLTDLMHSSCLSLFFLCPFNCSFVKHWIVYELRYINKLVLPYKSHWNPLYLSPHSKSTWPWHELGTECMNDTADPNPSEISDLYHTTHTQEHVTTGSRVKSWMCLLSLDGF